MAAAPSTGMEKSEMRALLKKAAPDNPINFAFAIGKEAGFALLKLHKQKNPKACSKMLEEEFADAKNTRWGTLTVDPDADSAAVRFLVNKPVSGMARRLTKTLKGTGFSKVEILLEDGSLLEGAAEDDEDAPAPENPEAPGEPASAAPQSAPASAPPPAEAQAPTEDPSRRLAGLIKRIAAIIALDPAAKEPLMKLATAANAALKNNDPAAATAIDALANALKQPATPPAAAPAVAQPENAAADPARLLATLLKRIPEAIAADPAAKDNLVALATTARAALKANDPEAASAAIDDLARALDGKAATSAPEQDAPAAAAAPAAATPAPAPAAATPDPAEYKKLGADWQGAQEAARDQLQSFVDALFADKDVKAHPSFNQLEAAKKKFMTHLPAFGADLEQALEAVGGAGDEKSAAAARAHAQKALASCTAQLASAHGLRELQDVADQEFAGHGFLHGLTASLETIAARLGR